jgi:putrescine importer
MTSGTRSSPTLVRALSLRSVVLFGLAYMTPLIVLGIFGVTASATGGASASAYALALIAMIFTALSYGKMAAAFPVAGSAYSYVRRTIDSRVGFLVGWAVLLDYLFLPMVIWLIGGSYLQAQFPAVPFWVWIVAFIAITTLLNVIGVQVADKANFLLMAFQLLVVVIFVALSIAHVVGLGGARALADPAPFWNDTSSIAGIAGGAAIAAYSFLGFDAVTTLTEETIEPRKTIPRAILLVALIGGVVFIIVSYAAQLVRPGGVFDSPDAESSAAFYLARTIGDTLFSSIFLGGLVIAQFASGLAAQAGASRLMYAMGRDSVLPHRVFGYLHPRFRTPVLCIAVTALVGLIALTIDVATSTSFINFGAFTAFTMVNVSVVAYYVRRRTEGVALNPFTYVLLPVLGAVVDLYLLTKLDSTAIELGLGWLAVGVIYLAVLTRGFRKAPPEVQFSEDVDLEDAARAER